MTTSPHPFGLITSGTSVWPLLAHPALWKTPLKPTSPDKLRVRTDWCCNQPSVRNIFIQESAKWKCFFQHYRVLHSDSDTLSVRELVPRCFTVTGSHSWIPRCAISHSFTLFSPISPGICVNLYVSVRKSCTGKMETQRSRGGPANFGCPLRCCLNVSLKICLIKSLELTALWALERRETTSKQQHSSLPSHNPTLYA